MHARKSIQWWHIVCDRHVLLLANGIVSESMLLGPQMYRAFTREERADIMAEKIREIDAKIEDLRNARAELVELFARPDKEYVDARLKELGLWLE